MPNTSPYNILYGINTAVGIVFVILTIAWIKKYEGGFGWSSTTALQFNWHPFLMGLSLVFLYSQAALIYRTGRYHTTKQNLKYIHALIHLLAFICAVIGLQAVFDLRNRGTTPHLYSVHSWIGLITVIIFAAQFLGGFVAFLYPGLPGGIRKTILPHHVHYGTVAFALAVITAFSGITEMTGWVASYSNLPEEGYMMNFMGLTAVLYGALTLYLLIKPEYKRIPLAED